MKRFLKEYIVDTIILTDFPSSSSTKMLSGEVYSRVKDAGVVMQVFDCQNVVSLRQVEVAVLNALAAMRSGRNIARDLGVELLVRLSTRREIDEAIRTMGISSNTRHLGVTLVATKDGALEKARPLVIEAVGGREIPEIPPHSDEELSELTKLYGVSDTKLRTVKSRSREEALEFAVLERMALMDV